MNVGEGVRGAGATESISAPATPRERNIWEDVFVDSLRLEGDVADESRMVGYDSHLAMT
jgi:hypothetical protein